ncbi:MAG: type II toxin-antitoxin system death-on-curing family toxin [Paracoccus sp. (in: a-proteobacteria)]|uniref:type II toxin-antitoxin system death-on-curing family toxin n=1 Tax=Paracoccus sp. TaxID=267 RepID=UPI0026DFFC5C|nr:type II toxin-antitoxin system death-on-curing family toxin [Paracoccus sp. (in: a-proteobacteria)]MDO5630968.1 type II toxin-antitoxin system death-on-curing family toxin [Paracoccus sp. (in: a-proteobacteria)]
MTFILLPAELVEAIHDEVLNPGELPGRALNKSLEGALSRVENRVAYGMIGDAYDLAAAYAMAIAQGHCFNDANKRTAHQSMDTALDLNGVQITWDATEAGNQIITLAQGLIDDGDLADWLRDRA